MTESKEKIIKNFSVEYETFLKQQLDFGSITKEDYERLHHVDLDGLEPATTYVLLKIHKLSEKNVLEKKIPKGRPIVSTLNSIYRKMDYFITVFMKPYINRAYITDYIQDTPELLRKIESINHVSNNNLPNSTLLQTQDIEGMYPNIKIEMCVEAWRKIWSNDITRIPVETLCLFLRLVLTHNLIEFNSKLYLQIEGFAMGAVFCPLGANGVMKFVIENITRNCISCSIPLPQEDDRFMDDRLHVWLHGASAYNQYENICNSTSSLTFTTDGPPDVCKNFLDLTIFIENNRIETKLYRNPVSKSDFYLNYHSSHPSSTRNSIPYSLALRIIRNCSQESYQTNSLNELYIALVNNSFYPSETVDSAFNRAKLLNRKDLLQPKNRDDKDEIGRTVFSTPFHPTLLQLPRILKNSSSSLIGIDPVFDKLMSMPPIVAWNRCRTLKQSISPSKFTMIKPPPPGTVKCDRKSCVPCQDILVSNSVKINDHHRRIIGTNNCDTKWVVYGLCCTTCDVWYIGKTFTSFKTRWSTHKSKIRGSIADYNVRKSQGSTSLYYLTLEKNNEGIHNLLKHFCQFHDNIGSLKWTIIDQIGKSTNDPAGNLLKYEHAYIEYFDTLFPKGLNSRD